MVQEKKQTEKDSKKDPKATEAAQQQNGAGADKQDDAATKKNETVKKQEELSEEDKQLQEELQMLIERLKESNAQLYKPALESLRTIIRSSTTSMTSVPKPLKFLRPHYDTLKEVYTRMTDNNDTKKLCAEIVSVVAMTMERRGDTLKYRILAGLDEPLPVAKPSQARKSETVSLKPNVASLTKEERERETEATGISSWGHEYVKHLTLEVEYEWRLLNGEYPEESDANRDELTVFRALSDEERAQRKQVLLQLAELLVAHNMRHNAEADAVDLLMEIERLDMLVDNEALVDATSYSRVCLYLVSCVPYVADPENSTLLRTAKLIYLRFGQFASALRCALGLNAADEIDEVFKRCDDVATRKQLCFMLARQQVTIDLEKFGLDDSEVSDLNEIQSNELLNRSFLNLATELDIVEPKTPEDVYKVHLEPAGRGGASSASGAQMDSAKQNLAASFVNGLVNCAFGRDKLLIGTTASADAGAKKSQSHDDAMKWIYKQKDLGMQSTTATLGWLLLWDVDAGLTQIDKFLYASEDMVKAGALLASGIVSCGVRNECDPALALLRDYVTHANGAMRQSAALGLALAYAGTNRDDILSVLNAVFADSKNNMEQIGLAALACGLIGVGSGNGDVCSTLLSTLMERGDLELRDAHARWIALALGLLFLGKQDACDVVLASIDALGEPMRSVGKLIVEMCAYAGTGNVLKVQQFLHICTDFADESNKKDDASSDSAVSDSASGSSASAASSGSGSNAAANKAKEEKDKEDRKRKAELVAAQQGIAVLGIALIAMGEDVGSEMAMRAYGHLLRYGEPAVKRAVPLALALLYVSNPKLSVIETLGKFAHDSDSEVAYSSILSLGLAGAGTNNSRLAAVLRALAVYHSRDPNALFLVRIAQGLTHLGKGTLTLSPLHSDRMLFSPTAVGGLLALLISSLDIKNTLLGRSHYVLFFLTPAIQPRMLVTLNESLKPLPVTVRVGQAVDVVGQAGKPKTITGFQTHTTPVILAHGERAELATEEYLSLTPVLEGFAILRKNPDYEQQHA